MPLLVSVCGLVCFFAFVFAVAGQMLFSESHHQRCQSVVTGLPEFVNGDEFGCAIYGRCVLGLSQIPTLFAHTRLTLLRVSQIPPTVCPYKTDTFFYLSQPRTATAGGRWWRDD